MATEQTTIGYDEARREIAGGRARAHALWVLISEEHQRNGYALKPSPWEGSGEYQRVSFDDGRNVLVRVPIDARPLRDVKATGAAS